MDGFFCPDDMLAKTVAALPRGRTWQTDGTERDEADSRLTQYWHAVADAFQFVNKRLCDLRLEFWCASQTETREQWMTEYGLPDACDPFPDLCMKVAALGGVTCEFYAAAAARIGWNIGCARDDGNCGALVGCAYAGHAITGGRIVTSRLIIHVDLSTSPAYVAGFVAPPLTGCMQAGQILSCEPDISPLMCLLDRIVHAHVEVEYRIIPPPTYIMIDDETHLVADDDGSLMITG